jgi:hypothetical protein
MKTKLSSRLWYIDNLRIFLISLVVLHHLAITYGAPGDWYYNESQAAFPEVILMSMFVATNQSFFMGMFFFISAFFILPSLNRKGTKKYITDRLVRLGIPLLVFYFILSPLSAFIVNRFIRNQNVSLVNYWVNGHGAGFGPLWFVEALFVFTGLFLLFQTSLIKIRLKFPGTVIILLTAFFTGLAQFVIRLGLPVGWSMPFTGFQFPFFVQYILLFALGIVAYQNNWPGSVSFKTGKRWFIFAQALILLVFPVMGYFGGIKGGVESFMGGLSWQSFSYAIWEQLVGFSLIIGLLGISGKYINTQGKAAKQLSGSAYGVFIFHTPVLVAVSALFVGWDIPQPLKFIALAPVVLVLCFLVAGQLKKIPGVQRII